MDVIHQLDAQLDDLDRGIISEESKKLLPKHNGSVRGRSKSPYRSPGNGKSQVIVESQMASPRRYRLLKRAEKKKLSPQETREQALYEIFMFYARQHIKKGVGFD